MASALRAAGVGVEIYPESAKLKKQFEYADRKSISFLSITGANEMEAGQVNLKNLVSGEQKAFPVADVEGMLAFLGR